MILDEATSALDNGMETAVMPAVEDLRRSLTVVIFAHRLSRVGSCDRFNELKHGCIARQTTGTVAK